MNKKKIFGWRRTIGLSVFVTVLVTAGCCSVKPRIGECEVAGQIQAAEAIPVLVMLAAAKGEALATARERVLAQLRAAMSADAFAAVRIYETLPIVSLVATPDVIALLLALRDVRSITSDQSFSVSEFRGEYDGRYSHRGLWSDYGCAGRRDQ